jgi:hypothetical protein
MQASLKGTTNDAPVEMSTFVSETPVAEKGARVPRFTLGMSPAWLANVGGDSRRRRSSLISTRGHLVGTKVEFTLDNEDNPPTKFVAGTMARDLALAGCGKTRDLVDHAARSC